MLANSLFVLASAALAVATPLKSFGPGSSCKPGKPMPVLPVNGGRKSPISTYTYTSFSFTNMHIIQPLNFLLLLKA